MDRDQISNPQLFHCPTCGASLPVPDAPSIRCEYCGSNVLVPLEYLPRKEADHDHPVSPVIIQVSSPGGNAEPSRRGNASLILILIVVFVSICVFSSVLMSATGVFTSAAIFGEAVKDFSPTEIGAIVPTMAVNLPTLVPAAATPPAVQVELLFGGDGTGPGLFDDPRYVAVDPQGNIFVADYSDGRIQKFDQDGSFIQLIQVEPDRNDNVIIRSMAPNFSGSLYIARGGDLLIYNTADGASAGSIPGQFPDLNHDQVAIDPSNRIYATNTASADDGLLQYDSQGNLLWKKDSLLEGIAPKNEPSSINRIAVDGMGNMFVLNSFASEIYKFDDQGSFLDRFGSKGNAEQQFNSPDAMAVDGKGRVFVVDTSEGYQLKVFDNSGSFLKSIPWPDELTFPRMIHFDVNGKLYTVTNTSQVARLAIQEEALGD